MHTVHICKKPSLLCPAVEPYILNTSGPWSHSKTSKILKSLAHKKKEHEFICPFFQLFLTVFLCFR